MNFIINRKKWRTGDTGQVLGKGSTLLRNSDGFMCCLGQVACQLKPGINLLHRGEPEEIGKALSTVEGGDLLIEQLEDYDQYINTKLSTEAMSINDNNDLTIAEREEQLTSLFKTKGVTLEFVN